MLVTVEALHPAVAVEDLSRLGPPHADHRLEHVRAVAPATIGDEVVAVSDERERAVGKPIVRICVIRNLLSHFAASDGTLGWRRPDLDLVSVGLRAERAHH